MKGIKFGLALPYISARDTADLARLAEEAGWDGCFIGDAIWTEDPMVKLAAAAMVTQRIRLGTMVIPVPLRRPWKIASESLALDHLSNGRLTLGLGAGAVWMGWQGFPDEVTDTKTRAAMLDETIDILTLLYQRKQFDYDGEQYHLKLSLVDEMHYPPKPVQQPRIPIWIPGIWPRKKSMRRVLKCDGLLPQKMNAEGQFEEVKPGDLRAMKAFVDDNRTAETPFDYVVEGKLSGMGQAEQQDCLGGWKDAGATWFIEGMWEEDHAQVKDQLLKGPPQFN